MTNGIQDFGHPVNVGKFLKTHTEMISSVEFKESPVLCYAFSIKYKLNYFFLTKLRVPDFLKPSIQASHNKRDDPMKEKRV